MKIPAPIRYKLYRYYMYLPNSFTRRYFQKEAEASPSLRAFGTNISSRVAEIDIIANRILRRNFFIVFLVYIIYVSVGAVLSVTASISPNVISIYVAVGATMIIALVVGLRVHATRSISAYVAITQLFFTISILEKYANYWLDPRFRWRIATRLERVARLVEQIPLAARSLAPDVKEEAFRLSRSKAQAIRQLELWTMRPMAFTFTDLIHQLVIDLRLMLEGRWYDLPEASGFRVQRSKWITTLQIAVATVTVGGAILLVAFAAKIGPTASIVSLVLVTVALALLNNAGISTGLIDQYLQTGRKIISE